MRTNKEKGKFQEHSFQLEDLSSQKLSLPS